MPVTTRKEGANAAAAAGANAGGRGGRGGRRTLAPPIVLVPPIVLTPPKVLVLETNSVIRLVMAIVTKCLLPEGAEAESKMAAVMIAAMNKNRGEAQSLTTLLDLEDCLGRFHIEVSYRDKNKATTKASTRPALVKRQVEVGHNGRGQRLGTIFSVPLTEEHTPLLLRELDSIALAIPRMVRSLVDWEEETLGLDLISDRNLGAQMHRSAKKARPSACSTYVQPASNADACVTCGETNLLHDEVEITADTRHASRISSLESQLDELKGLLRSKNVSSFSSPVKRDLNSLLRASSVVPVGSPSFSTMSEGASNRTIIAQPAQKLLTWTAGGYEPWRAVRDAALLAVASGTADHQRFHMSKDRITYLSSCCDYYAGNVADLASWGSAYANLCTAPFPDWIEAVDGIMRQEDSVPEFDQVDLVLKKDAKGKPMLGQFKSAVITFCGQDHFFKNEQILERIQKGVEVNFQSLSNEVLPEEYKRWRRDTVNPVDAIHGLCTKLKPYAATGGAQIEDKVRAKPPGWKPFFCFTCGPNDNHSSKLCTVAKKANPSPAAKDKYCANCKTSTHNTADCFKKKAETAGGGGQSKTGGSSIKYTGKVNKDGTKGDVPGDPLYVCHHCKTPGHLKIWCPKV